MALHTIQIVVVDGGKEGSYRANNATRKSSNTEEENGEDFKESGLYKLVNAKKTITKKIQSKMTPQTYFAVNQAVSMGVQVAKAGLSYWQSDIGRKHGDSNYQAIVNRRMEVIGQGVSLINGAVSGAATGAMFGGVGAAVGAVVGLASSVMSIGFQYAEKERDYQHEQFKNNTSQAYNLARANYSVSTGRMR